MYNKYGTAPRMGHAMNEPLQEEIDGSRATR